MLFFGKVPVTTTAMRNISLKQHQQHCADRQAAVIEIVREIGQWSSSMYIVINMPNSGHNKIYIFGQQITGKSPPGIKVLDFPFGKASTEPYFADRRRLMVHLLWKLTLLSDGHLGGSSVVTWFMWPRHDTNRQHKVLRSCANKKRTKSSSRCRW